MFDFLFGKKVNINSLSIPNLGWSREKEVENFKQWMNPEKTMSLSINFFDVKPDLPSIKKIDTLRDYYRKQITSHRGGLVEVNVFDLKGYQAVRTIFKIPQEPTGMTYLASITIPLRKASFVIKIQAPEVGTTGIRESLIQNKLMSEKKISFGDSGSASWSSDPYDSKFRGGRLMNKSEEQQFDAEFPDHPLTQARLILEEIEKGIEFGEEFGKVRNK